MSKIDDVKAVLEGKGLFAHDCGTNYVRVLDTPHIWGMPFGPQIMPQAIQRQGEFERVIAEMIQRSLYRCDVASLNCPDPDWGKAILGAMDTALTKLSQSTHQIPQFRFLFGQTPMVPLGEPWNLIDFKAALIRLVNARYDAWGKKVPEIWIGRFYSFKEGAIQSLPHRFLPAHMHSDDGTKMTWNHSKIIAVDGAEALVGGHNLNMDLFRSYPPVHDVSVVVHGAAARGSQLFLNEMWKASTALLNKESLDTSDINNLKWLKRDMDANKPDDPLTQSQAQAYMTEKQNRLIAWHDSGLQPGQDRVDPVIPPPPSPLSIREHDLHTLVDLERDVFQERITYETYDQFLTYKKASRILSVGKYWSGPNFDTDFKRGSELMKRHLILNAKRIIRISQMDLVSAWKKNWSDHVVCHWIMEALLNNRYLHIQAVVSPLNAGAGAEGDQYSFGSGASRTFELIKYYMFHNINDTPIPDPIGLRKNALQRLFVRPLCFTDQVPLHMREEGTTYHWPDLTEEGKTATLKQPPLKEVPPKNGIIGAPFDAVINASGFIHPKVPSAPGNHAKIMIVDDEVYVVGSDNLYPGNLSEFNYLVEGDAVKELLETYWLPLWQYSGPSRFVLC
jgi:murine toxin